MLDEGLKEPGDVPASRAACAAARQRSGSPRGGDHRDRAGQPRREVGTRLLQALVREAGKAGRSPPVYLQVNIGEEEQKGGVTLADLPAFLGKVRASPVPMTTLTIPSGTSGISFMTSTTI